MHEKNHTINIGVVGLVAAAEGSIEDPGAEPWFHIVIRFTDISYVYHIATEDGISFCYIYSDNNISGHVSGCGAEGLFLQRNKSLIQDAIRRYVSLCSA